MYSFAEAMEYLNHFLLFGKKQGLDGLRFFLRYFGSPEQKLRFIHLAGTNGKGSTAAALASILAVKGLRTGLYTSPYIHHFTERIRVLTKTDVLCSAEKRQVVGEITETDFAALLSEIQQALPQVQETWLATHREPWQPTYFEILTALAFIYFSRQACDVVVLETGLGGLLDSTNVITSPDICIITALNYDHCEHLGDKMEDIARQKAGILKPGATCFLYNPFDAQLSEAEAKEAYDVVTARAKELALPLSVLTKADVQLRALNLDGQTLEIHLPNNADRTLKLHTPLLGAHQGMNMALAVWAARHFLLQQDCEETEVDAAICQGVASVYWPVRLEVLAKHPAILVDGAHNLQGVQVLAETLSDLKLYSPDILCGFLENKDYIKMFACLLQTGILPRRIYCVTPHEPRRAVPAELVAAELKNMPELKQQQVEMIVFSDLPQIIQDYLCAARQEASAKPRAEALVCFGSLYLAGPFKEAVQAVQDVVY